MAGSVGDVAIKVVANAKGVNTGLSAAEKRLSAFERNAVGGFSAIERGAGGLRNVLASLGAGISVAGVATFVKGTIDRLDDLADRAGGIGETVRNLDQLNYISTRLGSSGEAAQTGVDKLIKSVGDAAGKGGDAAKAFERLGLDVNALTEMSPAEAFITTAGAISELATPAERASAAADIFGKSYKELMPIFSDTSGIREYAEDYNRLHGNVEEASETAGEAKDQFDRLKEATHGLGENMVIALGPDITKMVGATADALGDLNNDQKFVDDLALSVKFLGEAFSAAYPYAEKTFNLLAAAEKLTLGPFLSALDALGITSSQTGTGAVNQKKLDKWLLRGQIGNKAGEDIARRVAGANTGKVGMADGIIGEGIDNGLAAFGAGPKPAVVVVPPSASSTTTPGESDTATPGTLGDQYQAQKDEEAAAKQDEKIRRMQEDDAKKLTADLRTPWEIYEDKVRNAQELLDAGLISQETFFRATKKGWEEYQDSLEKAADAQEKLLNPGGKGGGHRDLGSYGGGAGMGYESDPMMDRFMQYNTLPGGYVGDLAPNIPSFTPPEWGSRQAGPSAYGDSAYGMDDNNRHLATIARNTRNAGVYQ